VSDGGPIHGRPPRLWFHGASGSVTGSCFAIEVGGSLVLVDCGMFQGSKTEKQLNYRPFPFDVGRVGAVLLTHAHIDHSGLLPKLVKTGYRGPIYATPATVDLCGVMLPDSGHIQEQEVEQLNRRNSRRGIPPVTPIYTAADAVASLDRFRGVPYGTWLEVTGAIRARFWNAGHLLGSASIEVEVTGAAGARPMQVLFSGDIGPNSKLLQPDPTGPNDLDYVLCESTYGDTDRIDATAEARRTLLRDEVTAAINPRGALLIPSFAVERAQELIDELVRLMREGALPPIPVYVDSPLAEKASQVFAKHAAELEGGSALAAALTDGKVHFTQSVEESMALDRLHEFHIVIAASGMCDAGRIRHRLKNWLWRKEATVLLVGYQAQGTLGRILKDGASMVRIQGDDITVRARIRTIELYSGHADAPELVAWVKARLPIRQNVFLVHGEAPALQGLSGRLSTVVPGDRVLIPAIDEAFDLTTGGARLAVGAAPPRVEPAAVGRLDWHNELSDLVLDINDAVRGAADERARSIIIRRIRRALTGDQGR
jgi:metallo-beta-lactamase family protein